LVRDDISWEDFRKKYIGYGGDGIYAAWALLYQEDSISDVKRFLKSMNLADRFITDKGMCPNAEKLQSRIMQFTTNQENDEEMKIQMDALYKTIKYFDR